MSETGRINDPAMTLLVRADSGDTFASIAAQFGCEEPALRAANPAVHTVEDGAELVIPVRLTQARTDPGDTWESVAAQFATTVTDLRAANPDVDTLTPGTVLTIPQ